MRANLIDADSCGQSPPTALHRKGIRGMLQLVTLAHLIVWIALLALVGQFALGLLAGAKRDSNIFYKLLEVVASPFVKLMRRLTPRVVLDRHVPLATFLVLGVLLVVLSIARISLCLETGVNVCV